MADSKIEWTEGVMVYKPWHVRIITLTDRQACLVEHFLRWQAAETTNDSARRIYGAVVKKIRSAEVVPLPLSGALNG